MWVIFLVQLTTTQKKHEIKYCFLKDNKKKKTKQNKGGALCSIQSGMSIIQKQQATDVRLCASSGARLSLGGSTAT